LQADSGAWQVTLDGKSLDEAFRDLKKCPSTSEVDHRHHIVAIAEPTIFCIRARDGTAYGKVKINKLFKDRIELDWVYLPAAGRPFHYGVLLNVL